MGLVSNTSANSSKDPARDVESPKVYGVTTKRTPRAVDPPAVDRQRPYYGRAGDLGMLKSAGMNKSVNRTRPGKFQVRPPGATESAKATGKAARKRY